MKNFWIFTLATVVGTLALFSEALPTFIPYLYLKLILASVSAGLFFTHSVVEKRAHGDWKFSLLLGSIWSVNSLFQILILLNHVLK